MICVESSVSDIKELRKGDFVWIKGQSSAFYVCGVSKFYVIVRDFARGYPCGDCRSFPLRNVTAFKHVEFGEKYPRVAPEKPDEVQK
jgi:hypothetical protein